MDYKVAVDLDVVNRTLDALRESKEAHLELIADHDARLGRTTSPNKATAEYLDRNVTRINTLLTEYEEVFIEQFDT